MVREFPPYYSDAGYNWSSMGHPHVASSVRAETMGFAAGFESVVPGGSFICQRTNHNHPFGIFYGENPLSYSFPLILLEISFVVIATRLVRFVLTPLRQPKIVAEIIVSNPQ